MRADGMEIFHFGAEALRRGASLRIGHPDPCRTRTTARAAAVLPNNRLIGAFTTERIRCAGRRGDPRTDGDRFSPAHAEPDNLRTFTAVIDMPAQRRRVGDRRGIA